MCPGPGPALGSAATSGKCSRSDGIKSPWKSSSQRVRTCEHNTKVPGSFLLHRGHEMFRDTPVSPYLDSNSDNKATRPAFIHLWVGNWVLEQRETRPLPKMSPNLPLNSAKMNEISCCLINFKRGDKLEIMLAAYTIQLWFPPCLGGFTGGGCLQDKNGPNLLCQQCAMQQKPAQLVPASNVCNSAGMGLDEAILKLPGKKAMKQHKGWVVKYLPLYRCSSFL